MEGLIEQEVAPSASAITGAPLHTQPRPPHPHTHTHTSNCATVGDMWVDVKTVMVLMGGCDVCAERRVLETRSK